MLEDAQVPYELHTYALDEHWSDVRSDLDLKLHFGQLPLLEDGEFTIVQTPSIIRYISRKLDLLPITLTDTARADMVADATQELADRWMTKVMNQSNSAKSKRDYLRHSSRILTGLEKILKAKNEGKAYFICETVRASHSTHFPQKSRSHSLLALNSALVVGNLDTNLLFDAILDIKVTFADYCAWEALDFNLSDDPAFLDDFPLLKSYHHRLPQLRPNLKSYLAAGRRIETLPLPAAPPSP